MAGTQQPRKDHVEPLWDRIDRNRVRVGLFVLLFIAAAALSLAIMVAVVAAFLGVAFITPEGATAYWTTYPYLILGATLLGGLLGTLHVARTLNDPERKLPKRFGAVPSKPQTLLPTKSALHDMSVAAGYQYPPRLWVIEDCTRINAFAVGLSEKSAVIGVTQGFIDRLPVDEQRAVFANLMARLKGGNTGWATAVSAIMGPIWSSREKQFRRDEAPFDDAILEHSQGSGGDTVYTVYGGDAQAGGAVVGMFVISFLSVLLTEALMAGHQRAAIAASEKADAEGMLLLKDPETMLRTINDVLRATNTVPGAGEAYSMLFYCWAGFGFAPEDDPEMKRIGRLREVIGAAGVGVV